MVNMERPDEYNRVVLDFLRNVDQAGDRSHISAASLAS